MSLMAAYVDGKLQTSTTSSDSLSSSKNKSTVDSDTFLTLLVAEMQNQDPLEPTSNTEWVSQYATFTQVEQMTEMSESMDLLRANSMVGEEVIMKVTSQSTGETSYVRGIVDYVTVEDGEAYLVIDEGKYSIDDLDSVASEEYFTAYDLYTEFVGMVDALPNLNLIDKSYENTVGKVYDLYSNLTEYQKNYIDKFAAGYVESYKAYLDKMEQFGVIYGEEAVKEEKTATLDDVLDAFNKKMDALMTQITTLNSGIQNSVSGSASSGSADSGVTDVVDKTENSAPEGGETTDGTQSGGGTEVGETTDGTQSSGGTEAGETTDGTQSSGGTEVGETTDGTQSSGGTEASGTADASQAAEQTGSSEAEQSGGENDATDDVLNQLTQDTESV